MYLHPNNGLVPNNHLRLEADWQTGACTSSPCFTSNQIKSRPRVRCSVHLQPAFGHCSLGPLVLCHLNALQCIGIWWECCVPSGDYWLPWNYLMELFISLDILYRRIEERGGTRGWGRWYWYFRWTHNGSEQSKHMTLFFSHQALWVLNHHLVCDCKVVTVH